MIDCSLLTVCVVVDIPASCEEALWQLGWQHRMLVYTDQFVLCFDVNDGTQSAGIQLAVSDLKVDVSLRFSDTGLLFSPNTALVRLFIIAVILRNLVRLQSISECKL